LSGLDGLLRHTDDARNFSRRPCPNQFAEPEDVNISDEPYLIFDWFLFHGPILTKKLRPGARLPRVSLTPKEHSVVPVEISPVESCLPDIEVACVESRCPQP
jgi:hypothetical protein